MMKNKLTWKQREYYALAAAERAVRHLTISRNYFRMALHFNNKEVEKTANAFLFDAQNDNNEFLEIADSVTPRCKDYDKFQRLKSQMEQNFAAYTADVFSLAKGNE